MAWTVRISPPLENIDGLPKQMIDELARHQVIVEIETTAINSPAVTRLRATPAVLRDLHALVRRVLELVEQHEGGATPSS